jgi:hypothetical protein
MKFESVGGSLKQENPQQLVEQFEESRIHADQDFRSLYTDFDSDMLRTEQLKAEFETPDTQESLGKVAEGLIFSLMRDGRVGEHLDFRAAHPYDDYCHGVDVIVEPKRKSLPALATFDITINQEDIKWRERQGSTHAEVRPSGLEGKLERSKNYIDHLAQFDAGAARDLSSWLRSGGLHEKRTPQNRALFEEAEKALLVKYYRTPELSEEPNRPGFVIGGPRAIISVDTLFVNKALQGNDRAKDMLRAISFVEFVAGIQAEQRYLKKLVDIQSKRNLLFDTHYSQVEAWSLILNQPEIGGLVDTYVSKYQRDPDFYKQLAYYTGALDRSFGPSKKPLTSRKALPAFYAYRRE